VVVFERELSSEATDNWQNSWLWCQRNYCTITVGVQYGN